MCRVVDLQQAVLAKNDGAARALRTALAARGTAVVNLLSSPGSGKTALLERELTLARERGVPVAALTADLATENDALRLARSGVPVKQVLTDACGTSRWNSARTVSDMIAPDEETLNREVR
ncbi:GTP-binding protein, partial [Streptomyces sp. NPDC048551]|uniref:GTP-binding protein n=1 Tax=Streptomyces sp. NPDC048551 TaxID=3155758 RepID=UPI0034166BC1